MDAADINDSTAAAPVGIERKSTETYRSPHPDW